jgi:arylsulfatase A-like enzyme
MDRPGTMARRRPVFLTALVLTAVLVACKALNLSPATPGATAFAYDLLVAVHEDMAFALCAGAAALFLLLAARRFPRIERILWCSWIACATLTVAYAVFSYRVYSVLYVPLTYRLLFAGSNLRVMASSLRVCFTPAFTVALVAVPLAYAAFARLAGTFREPRTIVIPWMQALVAAVALTACMEGAHRYELKWPGRLDRPLAESPHLALARSLWPLVARSGRAAAGAGTGPNSEDADVLIQDLGFDFRPEDLADFEPVAPGPYPPSPGPPPRNVLLYVLESTGAEYLDAYGAPYGVTPRLAEAADHAVVFDDVTANLGLTEGALVSITLSTYVPLMWRQVTEEMPDLAGTTLAQVLAPRGYRTAFLSAAGIDYANQRRFLAHRGFDKVEDGRDFGCPVASSWGVADACVVDSLLGWIDEDRARPFFAVVWTNQTHHPYMLPPGATRRTFPHPPLPPQLRTFDDYLNALAESDRQFGRVLDGLRARGLEDDTLLVVTGDHGEAFGAHHPTFLHGFHAYEEELRVPCIFHNPRLFPEARHDATVGAHVDLTPSIAQLLGVPSPGGWQGRSLFAPERSGRAYAFATRGDLLLTVREGASKYILDLATGGDELYDLAADPHEQDNAVAREPERAARLRQHLAAWMRAQKDRYRQGELTVSRY